MTTGRKRLAAIALLFGLAVATSATTATSQQHRIFSVRNRFFIEELTTKEVREFDMWSTRLANALFDSRFTDRVIANLDDYLRYGVNTLSVGIQGGNLGTPAFNTVYPRVYNSDGTLDTNSVVWKNLDRLLDETDRRGIVLMVQYWYFKRDENVPSDADALKTTRLVTQWLKRTGHRNFVLDLVNEFGHTEYQSRPLFTTVPGALQLLDEVYRVDPSLLAGMSPPGRLFCPEGMVGSRFVEATIIYSHNQPADPQNPNAYYLTGLPRDPLGKPYVNNEFNKQLRYENYLQRNPRTGLYTLGHWDQTTVDLYLADMRAIRALGGYANVFSHHQQYLTRDTDMPVAEIGPEGEQPEASPGAGEPSMHWVFSAIAEMRKSAPLPRHADFNDGWASGFELDLAGTWSVSGGVLMQTDANETRAVARTSTAADDVTVSVETGFIATPGPNARIVLQLGAASEAGPAYRVALTTDDVTLDQLGGALQPIRVPLPPRYWQQVRLVRHEDRVEVWLDDVRVIDASDTTPLDGRNLLLITENAAAAFDNLRAGPHRAVDFDDRKTGGWEPANAQAWNIVTRTANDSHWEASLASTTARHSVLDQRLADFDFEFDADLERGTMAGLRFRTTDLDGAMGEGHFVRVMQGGVVALDRTDASGTTVLGTAVAPVAGNTMRIRVNAVGDRIRVLIDGNPVLAVTDPVDADVEGGLVLVALGSAVDFDDLHLQTGPNRFPEVTVTPGAAGPLGAGMAITVADGDGAHDVQHVRVYLNKNDSYGWGDITFLLWTDLFTHTRSADGKSGTATLQKTIIPGGEWTIRFVSRDLHGNVTTKDYSVR